MNINILGVVGSIRSNHKHINQLETFINHAQDAKTLNNLIQESGIIYSNSDIAIAHALLGAKQYGAHIKLICITNIFSHTKMDIYANLLEYDTIDDIDNIDSLQIDEQSLYQLLEEVKKSDGIVLGTPVYFGDRSSIANKFLQLTQKYSVLSGKAFGVVSSGAKRNGGQETANIYTLQEAMAQNAIVVGNGPKTSQYGGTVWAGDSGTAVNDDFGLETCFGTGRQVAQLSEILILGNTGTLSKKLNITFLLTMDTEDKKYEKKLEAYIQSIHSENLNITLYNLINDTIYRCIACNLCPSPKMMEKYQDEDYPYHCVVQTSKDHMKQVQELLVNSDCIVFVGVNTTDMLIYRYQAFMERTRFIRHDDFELTNIPAVGMLINELGATNNQIFNLKVLTSFIRHNTFFLKPIEMIFHKGDHIYEDDFNQHIATLKKIRNGRNKIKGMEISYKATGYKYKQLDDTKKVRK